MFKKLKAIWHSIVAVSIVCIVIALLSVALPILIGLTVIIIIMSVGYVTYQANKGG